MAKIEGWVITVPYDDGKLHGYAMWQFAGDNRPEAIKRFIHDNSSIYTLGASLSEEEARKWKAFYRKGYRCIKIRQV